MRKFRGVSAATARWLGLFVVLSLVLSACAAPAAPAAAPAATTAASTGATTATTSTESAGQAAAPAAGGEVSRQDTLVYDLDLTDMITLDPAVVYEFSGVMLAGNIYETLVSFNPGDPKLVPVLASKWDVGKDGDNWKITFTMDPKAKFASGNPVTADDVAFSWGRVLDLNKSPAFLLSDVCKIKKENVKAVDKGTLEVILPPEVNPQVCLSVLTFSVAGVVEKAAVEPNMGSDFGNAWLNDHSAGSAPYVLNKWDRSVSITLDANPTYWGGTEPAMKRVIVRNMPELSNIQSAIETGDADVAQGLGADQIASLKDNPDVKLDQGLTPVLVYLGMNSTKAPLDNPDVREAIRYAINYDDIIKLLGGNAQLVQEVIPIGFMGHTGETPFKQDVAKAKELLAKAGVKEGTEINFLVPTGPADGGVDWSVLSAKLQSDLQQVGLELKIQQLQSSELLNIYRKQGGELVAMSWSPDFPDPDGNATPFTNWEAKSLAWRNDWKDQKAIDLSKQAASETDPAKREALYKELMGYVMHAGPYVIMYQPTRVFALRNNVEGFKYDPNDTPTVSFWTITKK